MRTKKALYNNLAAALYQIVTFLFGLVLPRLMISFYGSELNGLVSSVKGIVSYLQYLEMGITAALIYTLYAPIASQNYDEINPLVTRSKKEFQKVSLWYFVGVIVLSLLYPLMLKEEIEFGYVALIVFLVGIYGALDFFTLSKYRVLLTADQRYYIVSLSSTVVLVLQNITILVLLYTGQSLFLVVLAPTIFLPLRSLFLKIYVKKRYEKIDYSIAPSDIKLSSRKDAFINGLAISLNVTLPIVVVSLVLSLEMASVFSVYSMVFFGLTGIIGVFTTGMSAAFGNMFAKGENETIIKSNNYFEFLIYMVLTVLYSAALALIIPFIKVYVGDVSDINYIYPIMGILFTIWSVIHNSRLPNQTMIGASGKWKIATKTNIIQIVLLVIGMVALGYFFGVNGILVGMIVASLYKTIALMYLSNKKILNTSSKKSVMRLIRIFLIIVVVNLPIFFNLIVIEANNFWEWIIYAVVVTIASIIITMIINIILDWKTTKELYKKYIQPMFKKKGKP